MFNELIMINKIYEINESGGQFYQIVVWEHPKTCDLREESCASVNLPVLQDCRISTKSVLLIFEDSLVL